MTLNTIEDYAQTISEKIVALNLIDGLDASDIILSFNRMTEKNSPFIRYQVIVQRYVTNHEDDSYQLFEVEFPDHPLVGEGVTYLDAADSLYNTVQDLEKVTKSFTENQSLRARINSF